MVLQYHGDIEVIYQLGEISRERPLSCFLLTPLSFSMPEFLFIQVLMSHTLFIFFPLHCSACSNIQEGFDLQGNFFTHEDNVVSICLIHTKWMEVCVYL